MGGGRGSHQHHPGALPDDAQDPVAVFTSVGGHTRMAVSSMLMLIVDRDVAVIPCISATISAGWSSFVALKESRPH